MKILVAGLGSIGQRHVRNLRNIAPVEIIAYRRRNQPLPEDLRGPWLREFTDLDAALAERPTAALVCGPPRGQVDVAMRAASAGLHLFIEKPISDSLAGTSELLQEVTERKLVTLVGFNLRFHPQVQILKDLIARGTLGKIVSIRAEVGQYLPDWHPDEDYRQGYSARRDLGGGAILDLIHEIDLVRNLGGEVTEVSAFAGHVSSLEITSEDVAELILRFASGAIGNVHVDYVQRKLGRTCKVIGDKGTAIWDFPANEVRVFEAGRSDWEVSQLTGYERPEMYRAEMRHFLDCIEGRATSVVDLESGLRDLAIALAAHESVSSRQAVRLAEAPRRG